MCVKEINCGTNYMYMYMHNVSLFPGYCILNYMYVRNCYYHAVCLYYSPFNAADEVYITPFAQV